MEAGGLEIKKIFEDVIRHNVETIADYSTQTRAIVLKLSEEVKQLKNMIVTREAEIVELRKQLSLVQAKLYKGGTE